MCVCLFILGARGWACLCVGCVCVCITYLVLEGGACLCEDTWSLQRSEGDGGGGYHEVTEVEVGGAPGGGGGGDQVETAVGTWSGKGAWYWGGMEEAVEITMPFKGICNREKGGKLTWQPRGRRDLTFC